MERAFIGSAIVVVSALSFAWGDAVAKFFDSGIEGCTVNLNGTPYIHKNNGTINPSRAWKYDNRSCFAPMGGSVAPLRIKRLDIE